MLYGSPLDIKDPSFVNPSSLCFLAPYDTWQKDRPKQLPPHLPPVFVSRFFPQCFLFPLCSMDPLSHPEYLLLEQGERLLEGHTRLFLVLAALTSYPDDGLYAFYDASLKISCRALSSEDGPRANFTTFVEWTLARNGSPFPACSQENLASATPDPVPSPPSPRCTERMPEPTADGEPEPTVTDEPSPHGG